MYAEDLNLQFDLLTILKLVLSVCENLIKVFPTTGQTASKFYS